MAGKGLRTSTINTKTHTLQDKKIFYTLTFNITVDTNYITKTHTLQDEKIFYTHI